MRKTKVLVVDDSAGTRQIARRILETAGHDVETAEDGHAGLRAFFQGRPDLVLLDLMMPKMDGWTLLKRIEEASDVPAILLTALNEEDHVVRGLNSGARDYIEKPFSPNELIARVSARLRDAAGNTRIQDSYKDGAISVDFERASVYCRGEQVKLSPQEYRLLSAFVRNPNAVLSNGKLLDMCWDGGIGGPDNVRVYIGYLRGKLEEDPNNPELIETVRGFGYRYSPPA